VHAREPGGLDLVACNPRKYMRLALTGHPTVLLLLFVPPELTLVESGLGRELRGLTGAILSRRAGREYLGYLQGQHERLVGRGFQPAATEGSSFASADSARPREGGASRGCPGGGSGVAWRRALRRPPVPCVPGRRIGACDLAVGLAIARLGFAAMRVGRRWGGRPALVAVAPAGTAAVRVKPRLRGVFHEVGFYVAVAVGPAVIVTSDPGRGRVAAAIFAACVVACFGASALYHRPTWKPAARAWLARLDHACVYLLIAGSYAPFGLLVLSTGWAVPVLAVVWGGALLAILLKLFWLQAPKWLSAVLGLTLGWVGAAASSQLLKLPLVALLLVVVAGLLYTAGALVYALRRPDPAPQLFGYHELFHVLTVAAVAAEYVAVVFFVLPRA
jgi:hemolysin III